MPRPSTKPFQPSVLVGSLSLAFGLWIIIGALGHSGWASQRLVDLTFGDVLLLTLIPILYLVLFIVAENEYELHPLPPASVGALFTAAVLNSSITIAYCITTSDARNAFQHYFLVIGSIFAALAFETVTGLLTVCLESLERVNGGSSSQDSAARGDRSQ